MLYILSLLSYCLLLPLSNLPFPNSSAGEAFHLSADLEGLVWTSGPTKRCCFRIIHLLVLICLPRNGSSLRMIFIQIHVIVLQVFYPGESQPVFFVASRGHHADIGGITPGSMPPHSKYLHEEGATFKSFKLVDQGVFQEEGWYMVNFGSSK